MLCEKYCRSGFIAKAQFKKKHTHPPVRHDDSASILKVANVVTNVVNTFTQLRKQCFQCVEGRGLLRGNLMVFKEWLASKVVIHENL